MVYTELAKKRGKRKHSFNHTMWTLTMFSMLNFMCKESDNGKVSCYVKPSSHLKNSDLDAFGPVTLGCSFGLAVKLNAFPVQDHPFLRRFLGLCQVYAAIFLYGFRLEIL